MGAVKMTEIWTAVIVLMIGAGAQKSPSDFRQKFFGFNVVHEGFEEVRVFKSGSESRVVPLAYIYSSDAKVANNYRLNIMTMSANRKAVTIYEYDYEGAVFVKAKKQPVPDVGADDTILSGYYGNLVDSETSVAFVVLNRKTKDGEGERTVYRFADGQEITDVAHWSQPLMLALDEGHDCNGLLYQKADMKAIFRIKGQDKPLGGYLTASNAKCKPIYTMHNRISIPHSASFLDLNCDCVPDLFLTTTNGSHTFFEFWVHSDVNTYRLEECIVLDAVPEQVSQVVFFNFNENGGEDFMYYSKGQLHAWKNNLAPKKQQTVTEAELCNPPNKDLSFRKMAAAPAPEPYSEHGVMRMAVEDLKLDMRACVIYATSDLNLTGFTVDVVDDDTWNIREHTEIGDLANGTLKGVKVTGAEFFDIDDVGHLSLLVETEEGTLRTFMYIPDPSKYFIKSTAFLKTSLGQSRVGLSYQYLMTKNSMEFHAVGHQMCRNAYRSLQLPFMLNGLEHTQNYIEYMTFNHYFQEGKKDYSPLIPNSQLIIQKPTHGEWSIQLLVSPSKTLLLTLFMFAGVLLILCIVIIVLHCIEINNDKNDRKTVPVLLT